jgi:outer membrane lipoprotein-sorting protein
MNAGIRMAAVVLGVCFAMAAVGGVVAGADPRLDRIYAEITREAHTIDTITSDFEQERRMGLLDSILASRGRFFFKKDDRMRWEFTEPNASGFAVNGDRGKRWEAATNREERFSLRQMPFIKVFTDQVFAWARADLEGLQRTYRVEVVGERPADLKLVPLLAQMKEHVDHLRIVFAPDSRHVALIEITESDGDFTRIRFFNTHINRPLPDDLFD